MSDNSFYNIINSQFKEDEDLTSLINTTISKLMLDLRVNIVIANSNACVSGDYIFGKGCKIVTYNNIANALFSYGSLSVGKLAFYTGVNIKNMHRYLNTLENDGYIKRKYSPDNKKVTVIFPTKKLINLYDKYAHESRAFTHNLYNSRLSPDEQKHFLEVATDLLNILQKLAPNPEQEEKTLSSMTGSDEFNPADDYNYFYLDDDKNEPDKNL